jgi:hypothetical protein
MEEFCIAELIGSKICGKPIHCELAGASETDWDNRPGKGAKPARGRRPDHDRRPVHSNANTRGGRSAKSRPGAHHDHKYYRKKG